ncbi:MAG: putative toxin-antitoxin system toxin component, PIN family [Rhodocyclaceae bacterium]|nr:MAG: putative toxin-antitoxin system toxin component, PIN family [Rhodocyclaceae bacterium]
MRAVIDTNVLVSGLFWHGAPHALLERVRAGTLTLITSPGLLAELEEVIGRAKFDAILTRSTTSREDTLNELRQLAEVIEPPPLPQPVCRDPDDDHALALALAAQADLIVSGDDDLLALGSFQDIPIVTPAQAVQRLTA